MSQKAQIRKFVYIYKSPFNLAIFFLWFPNSNLNLLGHKDFVKVNPGSSYSSNSSTMSTSSRSWNDSRSRKQWHLTNPDPQSEVIKDQDLNLPMVGMVVTISPSFNLYKIVVFPAASRPTAKNFTSNSKSKFSMMSSTYPSKSASVFCQKVYQTNLKWSTP